MSQREFMIILAHTHNCGACRSRLLADPAALLARRSLSEAERGSLEGLKSEDFLTPNTLARAAHVSRSELESFSGEAVVRLRHI